jgi:DNA-binding MarR family transcriptional regulator/N-acetylglutamate synthase-like GNAT family acetyltransferase
METGAVDRVRRFNRTVTERVGALSDHFLDRPRPLAESRLLWEIGPQGAEVRELRARLALDSGYVSRLLRALERQRLVSVETGRSDARVRRVRLTAGGLRERALLDRRSDALARGLLEPLGPRQQERLLAAMDEVERLLSASQITIAVEDPASADARSCLARYYEEIGRRFEGGFDASRARQVPAEEARPPRGAFLVARLHGRPIGCATLWLPAGRPAELKRMWISPEARGRGLAHRLLADVEARAVAAGADRLHLDTNRALVEAIALYRRSGFVEVPPFNDEPHADHWFEKRLRHPGEAAARNAPPPAARRSRSRSPRRGSGRSR